MGAETVAQKLYGTLTGIQTGVIEDKMGWTIEIDQPPFYDIPTAQCKSTQEIEH